MILKYLHVILLASVKYFFSLPYAMIIGLDFDQAILAVLIGGISGVLFFYYLSKPVLKGWSYFWPCLCRIMPRFIYKRYKAYCERVAQKKAQKVFTRKSRIIAKIKSTYGLWGIVITTPLFLTIPLGAFLANKYYSGRKYIVLYLILSVVGWAVVFSVFVHLFPNVFL